MERKCYTYDGKLLEVGDKVEPLYAEDIKNGSEGIISKITYDENNNNAYITIVNESGKIISNVNSERYKIPEQYEFDNDDYNSVYGIQFFNDENVCIDYLPLTNNTPSNYKIPKGTSYISIVAEHLESYSCYDNSVLFNCFIDGHVKIGKIKIDENDRYYLETRNNEIFPICYVDDENKNEDYCDNYCVLFSNGEARILSNNFEIFKSCEYLQKFLTDLIQYFNEVDLTDINNHKIYSENINGQQFERKLIYKLYHEA